MEDVFKNLNLDGLENETVFYSMKEFITDYNFEKCDTIYAKYTEYKMINGMFEIECDKGNEQYFDVIKDGEWKIKIKVVPAQKEFSESKNLFIYDKNTQTLIIFDKYTSKAGLYIHLLSGIKKK